MPADLPPDPSKIGAIAQPPFAILPDPRARLRPPRRAPELPRREQPPRPLSPLSRRRCRGAGAGSPPSCRRSARCPRPGSPCARESRMPPIDRLALADDAGARRDARRRCSAAAAAIDQPEPARAALDALRLRRRRHAALAPRATSSPTTSRPRTPRPHLYAAAAVQVHAARLAATLDADRLVPIRTGVCPCCGGRPATSVVLGTRPHRRRPLRGLRHLRDALERGAGQVPRLRLDQGHRLSRARRGRGDQGRGLRRMRTPG